MYSIFKCYSIYWTLEMNDTMVVLVIKNKGKEEQKKLRKSRVRKFKITYTTYTYWIFPLHTSILLNFLFCKIFQKKSSFILYTYIPCIILWAIFILTSLFFPNSETIRWYCCFLFLLKSRNGLTYWCHFRKVVKFAWRKSKTGFSFSVYILARISEAFWCSH